MCSPAGLGPAAEADSLLLAGWRKSNASLVLASSTFLKSV